ncbi:MAG: SDR family oxidoreductase [Sphingobium sp.]
MTDRSNIFRDDLLAGRNVFLAGATSGINLEIAQRMAGLGATVGVISRDPAKVEAAVASLGPRASGWSVDVRNYEDVAAAIDAFAGKNGAIDGVVSGAAGNFLADAAKLSPKGFRTVIDIDLIGSFHVAHAAYPHLRRPGATVLFISALQSFVAYPQQVHACAAKAGIDSMMRALALEWGAEGVRVNSILPGPIAGTEGMARLSPDAESTKRTTDAIPLGAYGLKADIADLSVFLMSDAGANITGASIVSDGGSSLSR